MTDASLPAGRFSEGAFRVGHVFSLAWSVFWRNFPTFTLVTGGAFLPNLLLQQSASRANPLPNPGLAATGGLLVIILYPLSQAILLHAAFQNMSGRPVSLGESAKVGLRRFLPVVAVAITAALALIAYLVGMSMAVAALGQAIKSPAFTVLAILAGMIPAATLYLTWFVAIPACVIERLGPIRSLGRSRALTKGHRWKIFGLTLLILIPALIVAALVGVALVAFRATGPLAFNAAIASVLGWIISLTFNAMWIAFYTTLAVVTYHDLRVAREGVGTDQIVAVFE
jgi:uncharacterized membrane protein